MFNPKEIIFCPTDLCNLKCPHCFVERKKNTLNIECAKVFLQSASPFIEKVGFSGGEPFLHPEFLAEISKETVKLGLFFDQIMTNGVWWKTSEQLRAMLQTLFDAGYDGKIGLSWDAFHGQNPAAIEIFINEVEKIFGKNSVIIQSVKCERKSLSLRRRGEFFFEMPCKNLPSKDFKKKHPEIPVYYLPQSFLSSDKRAWKNRFWFKDDFCEGPGQILFVQASGNIAPCCGFANENRELFIGKITDNFESVIKNAAENKMIKLCYEKGLSFLRKKLQKSNKKLLPGITSDICTFCDFVCKNQSAFEDLFE